MCTNKLKSKYWTNKTKKVKGIGSLKLKFTKYCSIKLTVTVLQTIVYGHTMKLFLIPVFI